VLHIKRRQLGGERELSISYLASVISNNVGGVVVAPGGLEEPENKSLIDIVFTAFSGIDGTVVESLVSNSLFIFNVKPSESTNED
jgi:hypothetical protein